MCYLSLFGGLSIRPQTRLDFLLCLQLHQYHNDGHEQCWFLLPRVQRSGVPEILHACTDLEGRVQYLNVPARPHVIILVFQIMVSQSILGAR